jgi:TrpR family trp operon transcriptional repressor
MPSVSKYKKDLIKVFLSIKQERLMAEFLEDLLTPVELEEIIQRWQVIKMLDKGVPQRKIAKELGVSISTVTRGSRELRDRNGGFRKILDK